MLLKWGEEGQVIFVDLDIPCAEFGFFNVISGRSELACCKNDPFVGFAADQSSLHILQLALFVVQRYTTQECISPVIKVEGIFFVCFLENSYAVREAIEVELAFQTSIEEGCKAFIRIYILINTAALKNKGLFLAIVAETHIVRQIGSGIRFQIP